MILEKVHYDSGKSMIIIIRFSRSLPVPRGIYGKNGQFNSSYSMNTCSISSVLKRIQGQIWDFSVGKSMSGCNSDEFSQYIQTILVYCKITTAKLNYSNHFQQIVKKLDPVQNSRNVQKEKNLNTKQTNLSCK